MSLDNNLTNNNINIVVENNNNIILNKELIINFKKFEDQKISTKTMVAVSNIDLNLIKIVDYLPITDYIAPIKKRGRKKKEVKVELNKDIADGSIITILFEGRLRGVCLKKRKKKYFRNSFTIVMLVEGKLINFKVSGNGVYQITGCKSHIQAEKCILFFWDYIKNNPDFFTINNDIDTFPKFMFLECMQNIDFGVSFTIDRKKLAQFINKETNYRALLETSFGYTGVNIKIPIKDNILSLQIMEMSYQNDEWVKRTLTYGDYLDTLPKKEQAKKLKKQRYNTFLVFHSGKFIMSGICDAFMKDTYDQFTNTIKESYEKIMENVIE